MSQFPDLSAVPPEMASDGMLAHAFSVREVSARPYEESLPPPDTSLTLLDGAAAAHVWGKGPTVLLVHGWEGRHSQFAPLIEALVAGGKRVVSLDMPGHGLAKGHKSNPLEFSRTIEAAAEQFGAFEAMVGHSQGGNAVLHAASKGVSADRIVLIAPAVSIETYLKSVCELVRASEQTSALFFEKVEAFVGVQPAEFELQRVARGIDASTLIIHDKDDNELPYALSKDLADQLSDGRFISTRGLGHTRILADEAVVQAILDDLLA